MPVDRTIVFPFSRAYLDGFLFRGRLVFVGVALDNAQHCAIFLDNNGTKQGAIQHAASEKLKHAVTRCTGKSDLRPKWVAWLIVASPKERPRVDHDELRLQKQITAPILGNRASSISYLALCAEA